ncbi:MAG: hypothetical protein LBT40_00650 [Deltaproteobacteria bacterium]|nr:hypothetical protein [Deltaproteobacteria bacterium]
MAEGAGRKGGKAEGVGRDGLEGGRRRRAWAVTGGKVGEGGGVGRDGLEGRMRRSQWGVAGEGVG